MALIDQGYLYWIDSQGYLHFQEEPPEEPGWDANGSPVPAVQDEGWEPGSYLYWD